MYTYIPTYIYIHTYTYIYVCVYIYHYFFIHSTFSGHLGRFHVLAIVNSAAMTIGVHVSFSVMVFLGHMPSSGIAGLYGSFIPTF